MIYGKIFDVHKLAALGERYEKAYQFLKKCTTENLPDGHYDIDGDDVFANIMTVTSKPLHESMLENHHRYIDLHTVLAGEENVWVDFCGDEGDLPCVKYDIEKDIEFYEIKKSGARSLLLNKGKFLLLYPNETHAPCVAVENPCTVRRAIVKIKF